jgi:hypothetical protein
MSREQQYENELIAFRAELATCTDKDRKSLLEDRIVLNTHFLQAFKERRKDLSNVTANPLLPK